MATQFANLKEYIKDADDNFINGRPLDAANGFKHIYNHFINQENYMDAMYFGYRAVQAFDLADEYVEKGQLLRIMSIDILKGAVKSLSKQFSQTHSTLEKEDLLFVLQNCLSILDENEHRSRLVSTILPLYDDILSENDQSIDELEKNDAEVLFSRYLELSQEAFDPKHIERSKRYYAHHRYTAIKNSIPQLDEDDPDEYDIANALPIANDLIECASLMLELYDFENFKTIMKELFSINIPEDYYPHLSFQDYELPIISTNKELNQYIDEIQKNEYSPLLTEPSKIIIDGISLLRWEVDPSDPSPSERLDILLNDTFEKIDQDLANVDISILLDENVIKTATNQSIIDYYQSTGQVTLIKDYSKINHIILSMAKNESILFISNIDFDGNFNHQTRNFIEKRKITFLIPDEDKTSDIFLDRDISAIFS